MNYIRPEQVTSPRQHWNLIDVLDEGKEGTTALALGKWDNELRLGMRWNGTEDNPVGNPQSRGLPTWFLLEKKYHEAILQSGLIAPDKITLARNFLPLQEPQALDLRYMDFERYRPTHTEILKGIVDSEGQKRFDPNRDPILHGHLRSLLAMNLIEEVLSAESVTYRITDRGRRIIGS